MLNAAHSKRGSIGNRSFYGNDFVYFGIPADDSTHFDLDVYFQPAADFIHKALKSPGGKSFPYLPDFSLHSVKALIELTSAPSLTSCCSFSATCHHSVTACTEVQMYFQLAVIRVLPCRLQVPVYTVIASLKEAIKQKTSWD